VPIRQAPRAPTLQTSTPLPEEDVPAPDSVTGQPDRRRQSGSNSSKKPGCRETPHHLISDSLELASWFCHHRSAALCLAPLRLWPQFARGYAAPRLDQSTDRSLVRPPIRRCCRCFVRSHRGCTARSCSTQDHRRGGAVAVLDPTEPLPTVIEAGCETPTAAPVANSDTPVIAGRQRFQRRRSRSRGIPALPQIAVQ
jgi:hypothetical protein